MARQEPSFDAKAYLDTILQNMDEKFHATLGITEANRQLFDPNLSDAENAARGKALDQELERRFGPQVHPAPLKTSTPKPYPKASSEQEFLSSLQFAIGDTFSTTIDGSTERAEYLATLAAEKCEIALKGSTFGFFAKRRLRKAYQDYIAEQRDRVLL